MVEQRSSKSYAWVRILLSLLLKNTTFVKSKKLKKNYKTSIKSKITGKIHKKNI